MANFMDRLHAGLAEGGGFAPGPSNPRARLAAYMAHEADADQAEFTALVDAVVGEAVEEERKERLADHRTWQRDLATLRAAQDENKRLRAENAALQQRLHDAAMAKVWKNEDGKKFVFAEDIFPAILGVDRRNNREENPR